MIWMSLFKKQRPCWLNSINLHDVSIKADLGQTVYDFWQTVYDFCCTARNEASVPLFPKSELSHLYCLNFSFTRARKNDRDSEYEWWILTCKWRRNLRTMGIIGNCNLHKFHAFWFNLCFWHKLAQNCFKKVRDRSKFWCKKRWAYCTIAVKASSIAYKVQQHMNASMSLHIIIDTWRFLSTSVLHNY